MLFPGCSQSMHRSTVIACFAASVRKLRYGLGISQAELAERADLHRTYIADLERGARNPMNLPRLTVTRILAWADAYHRRTRRWPAITSGPVRESPGDTWSAVNCALRLGLRGLPGAPGAWTHGPVAGIA